MGKNYFGDVLDPEDDIMAYEVEDPNKVEMPKKLSLKLKGTPAGGVSVTHSADMSEGKAEGTYDFKHKNQLKGKVGDDAEFEFESTTKDYKAEVEWESWGAHLGGDQKHHASVEVEAKCAPAKQDWEAKVEGKFGM